VILLEQGIEVRKRLLRVESKLCSSVVHFCRSFIYEHFIDLKALKLAINSTPNDRIPHLATFHPTTTRPSPKHTSSKPSPSHLLQQNFIKIFFPKTFPQQFSNNKAKSSCLSSPRSHEMKLKENFSKGFSHSKRATPINFRIEQFSYDKWICEAGLISFIE
jgi:hypothetical protein